mmetsp:Transcript_63095/g.86736  ORF Transcript_63095/g.86736 Transcript_63095/m.86736 type:complete len:344 (-) Transcript_63095:75-1106(-)
MINPTRGTNEGQIAGMHTPNVRTPFLHQQPYGAPNFEHLTHGVRTADVLTPNPGTRFANDYPTLVQQPFGTPNPGQQPLGHMPPLQYSYRARFGDNDNETQSFGSAASSSYYPGPSPSGVDEDEHTDEAANEIQPPEREPGLDAVTQQKRWNAGSIGLTHPSLSDTFKSTSVKFGAYVDKGISTTCRPNRPMMRAEVLFRNSTSADAFSTAALISKLNWDECYALLRENEREECPLDHGYDDNQQLRFQPYNDGVKVTNYMALHKEETMDMFATVTRPNHDAGISSQDIHFNNMAVCLNTPNGGHTGQNGDILTNCSGGLYSQTKFDANFKPTHRPLYEVRTR